MKTKKKKKGVDIRDIRYVPKISTSSKIFVDKKTKSKHRRNLKKELKDELDNK